MYALCLDTQRSMAIGHLCVEPSARVRPAPKRTGFAALRDMAGRWLGGAAREPLSPHLMRDIGLSVADLAALDV